MVAAHSAGRGRRRSVADAERAAQAYDRPIDLELGSTPAGEHHRLFPRKRRLASVDGEAVISAINPRTGAGVILRVLLMPGPAEIHLASSARRSAGERRGPGGA